MGSAENQPSESEILEVGEVTELRDKIARAKDSEITEIERSPNGGFSAMILGHKVEVWKFDAEHAGDPRLDGFKMIIDNNPQDLVELEYELPVLKNILSRLGQLYNTRNDIGPLFESVRSFE